MFDFGKFISSSVVRRKTEQCSCMQFHTRRRFTIYEHKMLKGLKTVKKLYFSDIFMVN